MLRTSHDALEGSSKRANMHRRPESRRIYLINGWREQHISSCPFRECRVSRFVARIPVQVRRVGELRWIHEQRHHDKLTHLLRATHEREMPLVKRAHRGHETNTLAT